MKFKVNTNRLETDVSKMKTLVKDIDVNRSNMFQAMDSLNGMWDGAAHDAFVAQYTLDDNYLKGLIDTLREIVTEFQTSRENYDNCEDGVLSAIQAVNIGG